MRVYYEVLAVKKFIPGETMGMPTRVVTEQ